jgi:hypothetical protein
MRPSLEKLATIKVNYRPLKFYCSNCNQPIMVKYLGTWRSYLSIKQPGRKFKLFPGNRYLNISRAEY